MLVTKIPQHQNLFANQLQNKFANQRQEYHHNPRKPSAYEEHQRLFGYKPSKVYSSKFMKAKAKNNNNKKRVSSWNKDVVCLRSKDEHVSPNIEEKIELAQLKLCKKFAFRQRVMLLRYTILIHITSLFYLIEGIL